MKKRYLLTLAALALGAGCALMQGVTGSDVMVLLLRPFTLLGEMLRAWSFSGAKGNLGAWAVVAVLSLLPSLYILIARRKRKQKSDWLFFLASAVVFGALFLLVNPTIYVHPMLTEARLSSPELLTGGPVFSMLSMLLLCLLARWTGGLMTLKKQERRLLFWTRALLISSMALIAFSTAFSGRKRLLPGVRSRSSRGLGGRSPISSSSTRLGRMSQQPVSRSISTFVSVIRAAPRAMLQMRSKTSSTVGRFWART